MSIDQFLLDSLMQWGLYALMAIGLSIGFGVTRIINFAHGEFVMLGAYAAYWGLALAGLDPLLSLPLAMLAGFALGLIIFKLFIGRSLENPYVNQILLMFGISLILQNVALMLWTADGRTALPSYALDSIEFGGAFIPVGRAIAFAIALVIVVALFAWLKLTETGRAIRAVAQHRDAAILMGINAGWMFAVSFSVNAMLAAASGVALSFITTITPFLGFSVLIKAVAIVVLGGLGSVLGTIIGAAVLAVSETGVSYFVQDGTGWAEGVSFVLLVGILLVAPRGVISSAVED